MTERWLPVKGYEGLYEVSDLGNVRTYRVQGKRNKVVPFPTYMVARVNSKTGRRNIGLRKGDHRRWFNVYRLVLEAFVGPCPLGMEACHYDGDCTNDRLDNLRWDTRAGNIADKHRHGTMIGRKAGIRHHNARLNDDDIRCIRAEPFFPGVNHMLAKAFGVGWKHISAIRNGHTWGHVEQYL